MAAKGRVETAYLFTCGKCNDTSVFDSGGNKRRAEQRARDEEWCQTADYGWVCPTCTPRYTYTDLETAVVKSTMGTPAGWVYGKLHGRPLWYLRFDRDMTTLDVPEYCLTRNTRRRVSLPSEGLTKSYLLDELARQGKRVRMDDLMRNYPNVGEPRRRRNFVLGMLCALHDEGKVNGSMMGWTLAEEPS